MERTCNSFGIGKDQKELGYPLAPWDEYGDQ